MLLLRSRARLIAIGIVGLMAGGIGLTYLLAPVAAQAPADNEAEPAPPPNQTYVGTKKCASCHFDQFLKWKQSGHSKAFDMLTDKYQKDEKCLKCHTTGYGEETGFKDATTTPSLVAVSCESCHGPGSIHSEMATPFLNQKDLTPEQEKMLRDSIWMMLPKNVCVECHMVQGHHDSQTPPELRKAK